jgi:DNA-binding transcriptional ArsR family regulator
MSQSEPEIFKPLDPILQNPLRLALVNLLAQGSWLPFGELKEKTGASPGNLSSQIGKLKTAGYVEVNKQFRDNYPQTRVRLTEKGKTAFLQYAECMLTYLQAGTSLSK